LPRTNLRRHRFHSGLASRRCHWIADSFGRSVLVNARHMPRRSGLITMAFSTISTEQCQTPGDLPHHSGQMPHLKIAGQDRVERRGRPFAKPWAAGRDPMPRGHGTCMETR
jgi:hypothetical protein